MTTDELRAKFEAWVTKRHGVSLERWADSGKYKYDNTCAWWEAWLYAHASCDGEASAMRKDAKIGRFVLNYAAWIRDGDDTLMEIRFPGHVDLSSVGTRRDAIENAMSKESAHE